ncbi:DUF2165 family protein [Sulfitobacter sabulilitoris]|uniref:DUF2165 domain-containing protein n=1 Tax=Sulfitobacter sabulilitoris TaxID=2562655 RepID=A0A5S3PFU1_9RHOB|nr:DUF2165 family protein [Sulfitobacter sabulilitoris]TMM52925.1 DUF2165 domain-containing protein [Sulfitobacter sabulilitoris]
MELALLLSQTVATGLIALWLSLGLRDNLLFPALNLSSIAEVMRMDRMRKDYPDEFAVLAHRAVTDPRLHRIVFLTVLLVEALTCLVLWLGVVALLVAAAGAASVDAGRGLALAGATLFTGLWAGFLIGGNHFSYWFCHEAAQNTHFQMTLWGVGSMIVLMQG